MNKRHTNITEIQDTLQHIATEREWDQYHSPRNLVMALSVEVGELMELFLWASDNGPQPPLESRNSSVQEEVADVFICLLNICRKMDIDLIQVTSEKIEQIRQKYPVDKSKGRLEKHTEL